jgi:hypothetical protein
MCFRYLLTPAEVGRQNFSRSDDVVIKKRSSHGRNILLLYQAILVFAISYIFRLSTVPIGIAIMGKAKKIKARAVLTPGTGVHAKVAKMKAGGRRKLSPKAGGRRKLSSKSSEGTPTSKKSRCNDALSMFKMSRQKCVSLLWPVVVYLRKCKLTHIWLDISNMVKASIHPAARTRAARRRVQQGRTTTVPSTPMRPCWQLCVWLQGRGTAWPVLRL